MAKGLTEEQRKEAAIKDAYMKEQIEEVKRLRAVARVDLYPLLRERFTPKEASRFLEWFNTLTQQAVMKMAQDLRLEDLEMLKNLPSGEDKDKIQAIIGTIGKETVGSALKITGAFVEGIKTEKDVKTADWTWEQIGLDFSDAPEPEK